MGSSKLWNIAHAIALWYAIILKRHETSFENGIRAYQISSHSSFYHMIIHTDPFPTVITAINMLIPAFNTLDRITEIEPDILDDSQSEKIEGTVEFDHVNFKYPLRPAVTILDNFSLKIEDGSKVAFVGPSGAGKSSV